MKKISILGSTGSIGVQTLDVVRSTGDFQVMALTTNRNIDLLKKQIEEFKPLLAVVMDEEKAKELKKIMGETNTVIKSGMDGLVEAATLPEAETIVVSVVGNIGIKPTYEAIMAKKEIALATKEVLVST